MIEIRSISEISGDGLAIKDLDLDIAVVAPQYGSRAEHILRIIKRGQCRVVAPFDTRSNPKDDISRLARFHEIEFTDAEGLAKLLFSLHSLAVEKKNPFSVLIDVSAISRRQLGDLFATLKELVHFGDVQLYVAYTLAKFSRAVEHPFPLIKTLAPIHFEFSGFAAPPWFPVDAIVGLGYEKGKAVGAVEYLEPSRRWIFVPESPEESYLPEVIAQNKELFGDSRNVFRYGVLRPMETYYRVSSLLDGLSDTVRPVVLPFGPRIFVAITLLIAMCDERIAIWHVDSEEEVGIVSSESAGVSALLSCLLSTSPSH